MAGRFHLLAAVLAAATLCLVSAGTTRAAGIPLGSAVWFACTEPSYQGTPMLACPLPYDPRYVQTFLSGFDRLTPENEFKMLYLEPRQGQFDFTLADQIARFAQANGKTIRGHTLIWGRQLPGWVQYPLIPWDKQSLGTVMRRYISTVVAHFAHTFPGVVTEWDVVNEPLTDDGRLAGSPWLRAIGPDYISDALQYAHLADPAAKLVINENGADIPGPKADALLALATRLKRGGVPLTTIGFQAHVTPDSAPSIDQLVSLWRRYAAVGLDVEVTELDVNNDDGVDDPAEKLNVFRSYALACRMAGNCTGVTVWGVADQYSWLGPDADALLYDTEFTPKPAATAVQAILTGRSAPDAGRPPRRRVSHRRHRTHTRR